MDMPSDEERKAWRDKVQQWRAECTDFDKETAYAWATNDYNHDGIRRNVGRGGAEFQRWYDEKFTALENDSELFPIDEELREELNDTLRSIWLAGWKITDVGTLQSFEKAMSRAFSEGWDAEHEDCIDYLDAW